MPSYNFDNRVALVTGAAAGIGQATAKRFAEEGASVVAADIDEEAGQETVDDIESNNGEAIFVSTDVSNTGDVEQVVDKAVDTYGRLDFAHNNAATEVEPSPIAEVSEEDWEHIIDINQKGVWLGMKYEVPAMLNSGTGSIVNTSSMGALSSVPGRTPYVASKGAINSMTGSVAKEYAEDGIRANVICPGPTLTRLMEQMTPKETQQQWAAQTALNRLAQPEEMASVVMWLCSGDASYVTGNVIPVDGGQS